MTTKHTKNRTNSIKPDRKGAATIEFVFALPFLLLLMVCLTWLGFSMLYQAEVRVIARHDAWEQRFENNNADPFIFTTHPAYKIEDDFALGESKKTVNVSKLFDAAPDPSAIEIVMSGTWDHRDLPLDEFPNWDGYKQAVINAKTGDLQNLLGGMGQFKNVVRDIGTNLLSSQLSKLGDTLSESTQAQSGQLSSQNTNDRNREQDKARLLARKSELQKEIDLLRTIENTNSELTKRQKRKEFRLRSELNDVNTELRELG